MRKIKFIWEKITVYQKGLLLVFLTWGGYLAWLFPRMLFRSVEGIWAGGTNVWGDWAAHFAFSMPFAYGKISDWLVSHPLFLERKLTYPFLVDAFSGILIRFGVEETLAFWLPSLLLGLVLLGVLYKVAFYYSQSILQSFLVITIFLASGGLGFIFFLESFISGEQGLFSFPQEYTHIESKGIFWINTISSEFVPQRSFPLGMALALLIISQWISWLKIGFEKISRQRLLSWGILSGLMPVVHTHSFLVLFFSGAFLLVWNFRYWRKWLWVVAGALFSFAPIFYWFYSGQLSASFFSWHPGWMANNPPFFGNWLYFWLLNWGIFLPMAFWSAWKTKFFREPIFGLGLFLFALCNLFLFQPWDWDNSKILTFSYFFLALPVGIYLGRQMKKNFIPGITALVCLELLIFSGSLDLCRALQTQERKILLWNNQEIQMAENFRKISAPSDVVLTSDQHNHFIRSLSGRKTLMAYRGWMWSYGIDYAKVEKDMLKMYSGGEESQALLKRYKIKFVAVGPSEKNDWQANEKFFSENFPLVLENSEYKIFKVN